MNKKYFIYIYIYQLAYFLIVYHIYTVPIELWITVYARLRINVTGIHRVGKIMNSSGE